jgi:hypothetical protein
MSSYWAVTSGKIYVDAKEATFVSRLHKPFSMRKRDSKPEDKENIEPHTMSRISCGSLQMGESVCGLHLWMFFARDVSIVSNLRRR